MSAGLARNWWAVGLRAVLAVVLVISVVVLPRPTLGALTMMFAAYLAADGVLAVVSGLRAMRRGERWLALIVEGATNLAVAGGVVIWPALAAVAFVSLTSAWAIITGALLLAAARRLSIPHGRWLLALAGTVSAVWGVLAATVQLSTVTTPDTMGWWLIGYALPFAVTLLVLAVLLQRRDSQASPPVSDNV